MWPNPIHYEEISKTYCFYRLMNTDGPHPSHFKFNIFMNPGCLRTWSACKHPTKPHQMITWVCSCSLGLQALPASDRVHKSSERSWGIAEVIAARRLAWESADIHEQCCMSLWSWTRLHWSRKKWVKLYFHKLCHNAEY